MRRPTTVLDAPEQSYVAEKGGRRRMSMEPERRSRRAALDDPGASLPDEEEGGYRRRKRTGVRLTFRGGLPSSTWGRVATGAGVLACLAAVGGCLLMVREFVVHDPRFVLRGFDSVVVEGNQHLSRAQLLSVFGGDVERNLFGVSLAERQSSLESLPWVKRATVMRLLPDRLHVDVTERIPVAFVRHGKDVGLVDDGGVLLDLSPGEGGSHFSFPVVTGIERDDPDSVREARMRIYTGFLAELDSAGDKISARLSEVDLSNPEDIKALIPIENGADVLVHFGDGSYLERYRKFQEHLPEWRQQYPKLASVDMRYERQVVLEMHPGSAVPLNGPGGALPTLTAARGGAKTPNPARATPLHAPAAVAKTPPATAPAAAPKGNGASVAAHANAPVAGAPGKRKPELVGYWTPDGKYHPPRAAEQP